MHNDKNWYTLYAMEPLIVNRRAHFDYKILETYEAGVELLGFEVKAIKIGRANIAGAFVTIKNGEAFLLNATVFPYQVKNTPASYDPARSRRLLLKRKELHEIIGKISPKGLTMIPLKMYNKRGKVKLLIGVVRHKKASDKREVIKKRETNREIERVIKRE